ncbi:MAG: hypothetical protein ACI4C5_08665 [Lachnospiraceae bacterium]
MAKTTKTVNTNDIKPGTRVTMKGQLDDFTWNLNHLLEGKKLEEQIARQKAAGWKFPKTNPRSEFRLVNPSPAEGTKMDDENVKKLLTYLKESKSYEKDGTLVLECVRPGHVPLMGVKQSNGRIKEVRPTGSLEAGQTVLVEFQTYATEKGNNGVSVNTVVFLEEPKIKTSLPDWDRMEEDDSGAASDTANESSEYGSALDEAEDVPAEELPWNS